MISSLTCDTIDGRELTYNTGSFKTHATYAIHNKHAYSSATHSCRWIIGCPPPQSLATLNIAWYERSRLEVVAHRQSTALLFILTRFGSAIVNVRVVIVADLVSKHGTTLPPVRSAVDGVFGARHFFVLF